MFNIPIYVILFFSVFYYNDNDEQNAVGVGLLLIYCFLLKIVVRFILYFMCNGPMVTTN